jgi:putative Mg2+ transporter-C (MgtC) family protein
MPMTPLSAVSITMADGLVALAAAMILGALIGLERLLRHHPAGLHMNALVSLGSAAFVLAGLLAGDATGPARVAGQVVTGVGFLCAGVILHQGATVRGINTAATVWCSSAVGVLAGMGLTLWACAVALLVLLANVVLHYVEHRLAPPGGDG